MRPNKSECRRRSKSICICEETYKEMKLLSIMEPDAVQVHMLENSSDVSI